MTELRSAKIKLGKRMEGRETKGYSQKYGGKGQARENVDERNEDGMH